MGKIGLVAACSLLTVAPASAQAPAGTQAQQVEDIVVTAQRTGIPVWRVHGPTTTLVLIGTIEGVAKDTRWDPNALTETLRKADRVLFPNIVEVSTSPFSMIGYLLKWRKQATLPKGQTLAGLMPARDFQRLVALRNRGVLKAGFERKHPLHLSLMLQDAAEGKRGLGADPAELVRRAVRKHKIRTVPVKSVRAKNFADDFFATPPKAYLPCLLDSISMAEAGPAAFKARSDAWIARRIPDVLASPSDKVYESCVPPAFESVEPANLPGQIAGLMAQPQLTVAVVDLRSLAQPNGVLDRLAAAGYDVAGPKWKR